MTEYYGVKHYYVVTDDIEYARNLIAGLRVSHEIISNDVVSDFYVIANIKKRILSNSTFSLWASALGDNVNSVVIAPKLLNVGAVRPFMLPNEITF